MAGTTSEGHSFGRVSRTVGVVFHYLLLAATLVGIVALGVLLVFVTNDAIRPLTAEPAWLLLAGVGGILVPGSVATWLYRQHPDDLLAGGWALGTLVVGIIFGGGAVIIFTTVIPPVILLAWALALIPALLVVLGTERLERRIPFLARLVLTGVVAGLAFWQIPPRVQNLGVLPADWLILLATLGLPGAAAVGQYISDRIDRDFVGLVSVIGLGALITGVGYLGVATGLGGDKLVVFVTVGVLPAGALAVVRLFDPTLSSKGLALPVAVIGGVGGLLVLERLLGLQGPHAWLTWDFLTATAATPASEAGIYPGIVGTILLMFSVALVSFPVGVGAAIYLEEYAGDTTFTRIVDVNISNLAGVPSVVYGLLGLGAFVRFGGLQSGTVIVGGLTLALLILPIVIISSREAIRAVPDSRRQASYGMGATRWQTVRNVVLPDAIPGILTGTILALGRAIGETAPLLVIGAPSIFGVPDSIGDKVGAIPLQIYAWASTFASEAFYTTVLAAGVVTILVILLTMNSIAIVLRNKYQRDT